MKRLIVVTLCVLTISSIAMADYSTDFEGWVDADLEVVPWGPGLTNGTITTGLSTNTSDVVQLGASQWGWYEPAEADQFTLGTLEFDILMNGPAGHPSFYLYMADDDLGVQAVYWRVAEEAGAGGSDLDLYDFGAGTVVLTDFMSKDEWVTFKINFDADTDTYDFYVNDFLELNDQPAWGNFTEVNRIAWNNGTGYYVQIDNVMLYGHQAAFTNETATLFPTSGILVQGYWTCWGDYNNDGYVDFSDYGRLFKNNGGTGFTWEGYYGDVWGDYNNDGKLDSYRWTSNAQQLYRNLSTPTTTSFDNPITMPDLPAGGLTSSGTSLGGCWADFNGDGFLDVFVGGANPDYTGSGIDYHDVMLINNSAASFTSSTLGATPKYTKGVTACDWDEDGDMDIYTSIYALGTPNRLWRNDGSAGFTDVAASHNAKATSPGFTGSWACGAAWGDIDNDGDFDLFAGNFSHPGQPQSRFLENKGSSYDYEFEDRGTCGVTWVESYCSPTLGDYDNDGDLDLFITAIYTADCRLYRNDSSGSTWTFTNVTATEGLGGLGPTAQAAWADFDNDGDMDMVTHTKIFVNSSSTNGNHWLRVKLKGNGSTANSAAIGAQARIVVPGLGTITRQVEAGTGQGNQNDPTLHFGLGSYSSPVEIEITWPDGSITIANTAVDQTITVAQEPESCSEVLLGGQGYVSDISGPSGESDCYVDFFDFASLAYEWQNSFIITDLQQMADEWLRCNDPCDIICGPDLSGEFSEDFEPPFATSALNIAPWSVLDGTPAIVSGTVELNIGDEERLTFPDPNQRYRGSVEFDLYIASGGSFRWTAKDTASWRIARFYFETGGGDVDIATNGIGANFVDGVMALDSWAHFKLDFDNISERFSLKIDNNSVYTNMPYNESGYGHDFSAEFICLLDWELVNINDVLFDNVTLH